MGRLLTISQPQSRFNKKPVMPEIKVGPVTLTFVTIVIFCLLAFFYLSQSSKASTRGYEIKKLETQSSELKAENERLQVESARLQSIKEIEKQTKELNMTPTKKVEYWTPNAVANSSGPSK